MIGRWERSGSDQDGKYFYASEEQALDEGGYIGATCSNCDVSMPVLQCVPTEGDMQYKAIVNIFRYCPICGIRMRWPQKVSTQ